MMKIVLNRLLLLSILLAPVVHAVDATVEKQIRDALAVLVPDEEVTRIRATPFRDLYEVLLGTNVIYISGDGRYILRGDLLDMKERENLSEKQRTLARKQVFELLTEREYIEFSPVNVDHLIYVFTDIDCGYCRRLHRDVPVLNENGVGVRYLAYPRGGMGSETSRAMEAVWCAEDRRQALTDAKNGKRVESRQCSNPVAEEYELGKKFGVRGTPAIYTENGEELRGYVPPAELIEIVTEPH